MKKWMAKPLFNASVVRNLFSAGLIIKLKWYWLAKLYQLNISLYP